MTEGSTATGEGSLPLHTTAHASYIMKRIVHPAKCVTQCASGSAFAEKSLRPQGVFTSAARSGSPVIRSGAGKVHLMRDYPISKRWYERAKKSLAAGVSSQFRVSKPHPMFYERAEGPWMWDVDGNRYLDYTLAQGPMILGHSNPRILEAISEAMHKGQLFAGQHEQEVLLAESLCDLIPSAERVRFSSTGSEADHAVIRMARYATGKRKIIKFEGHYHGWLDEVCFNINPSADQVGDRNDPPYVPWSGGVPEDRSHDLIILPWNDLAAVQAAFDAQANEIAAVIMEPVMCNQGCIEPAEGFLTGVRDLCDHYDAALIFDEIITGFRIDIGGAQKYYGVTPDLAVFGKALGSGLPISALVGKARFFEPIERNEVFHAGTLNSNNICVAAALKTVDILREDDQALHKHIVQTGRALRDGLAQLADQISLGMHVQGPGPMFHVGFLGKPGPVREYRDVMRYDAGRYTQFAEGLLQRGVRVIGRGIWYVSSAHVTSHVEQTLEAAEATLQDMAVSAA